MIPTQSIGYFRIRNHNGDIRLLEHGKEWMNNGEKELTRHQEAIDACYGKVLIGGLGIGYIVEQLNAKPEVSSITVVEIASEVIEMVWPYIKHDKCEIIQGDIFNHIAKGYDFMCFDIHIDLSKDSNDNIVKPLRKLAEQFLPPNRIFQWRERNMECLNQ